MILNLGISPGWQKIDLSTLTFPTEMLVDYVRIYQRKGHENVGCSPDDYPTEEYITNHLAAYTSEPNTAQSPIIRPDPYTHRSQSDDVEKRRRRRCRVSLAAQRTGECSLSLLHRLSHKVLATVLRKLLVIWTCSGLFLVHPPISILLAFCGLIFIDFLPSSLVLRKQKRCLTKSHDLETRRPLGGTMDSLFHVFHRPTVYPSHRHHTRHITHGSSCTL